MRFFLADYALFDHTFHTFYVSDYSECATRCIENGTCQSYNIQTNRYSDNQRCELNNNSRMTKPQDFKRRQGFAYYGLVPVQYFYVFFINKTRARWQFSAHFGTKIQNSKHVWSALSWNSSIPPGFTMLEKMIKHAT